MLTWFRGDLLDDDTVRIAVNDRTFEHGLGLFETFRTWNGRATLLPRHRDRMQRSAEELGLPLDPSTLPDAEAVRMLCEAAGPGDHRLRIVLSGGMEGRSTVWMTAAPLPPPAQGEARILRSILADPDDPLARHKTLNYWRRRIVQAQAAEEGAVDVVCVTPEGQLCEGTRSNLFLIREGRLFTPSTDGPLLPGVMRRFVIERARALGIDVIEEPLPVAAIDTNDEAFLTNAVRGMLPLARLLHAEWDAPGPLTSRLWERVYNDLTAGAIEP